MIVLQNAVGRLGETAFFDASGTLDSIFGSGSFQMEVVPMDEAFSDLAPTLIKMDIEGVESNAFKSAENIIKQNVPVLVVCTCHRQENIWQIPFTCTAFNRGANFFYHRYSTDCREPVCYAVSGNRLI